MTDDPLREHRETIDRLDRELIALLSDRARAAQAIGAAKAKSGEPIFVPHREQEVFKKVCGINDGPLSDHTLRAIWREIMSGCIALEQPTTICHFGTPGSFTHQAARGKFGDSMRYVGNESIANVFDEVERGHADYGIVPIENSTDGSISDTIDCFQDTSLQIINEIHLRIRHHLMATGELANIKRVYSKHTVFGQCREWIHHNLPNIELVETGSTTLAAERAANDSECACIGNEEASGNFGLNILARDVQDDPNNITRFVILGKPHRAAAPTGNDKTNLLFTIRHEPGALYEALLPFHDSGISMTRIESRPSRKKSWEYVFFIDIIGHKDEPHVSAALDAFDQNVPNMKILGSYPRNEHTIND